MRRSGEGGGSENGLGVLGLDGLGRVGHGAERGAEHTRVYGCGGEQEWGRSALPPPLPR